MASSFMADISTLGEEAITAKNSTSRKGNTELKMEDFLKLMVVQLQNQTMDDTADTGEMLNQLVQMQMVTALSNMTDASVMSYASSLVGKEVTIGTVDKDNNLQEEVLTVIGTGQYSGQQVIFCDDGKMYQLNQVMAVGRLPEIDKDDVDFEKSDFEKDANNRIDQLVSDIKNGKYDSDKTEGATDAGTVNGTDADSEAESNTEAESSDGTVDPLKNGVPDEMLASSNQSDPEYDGGLGAPKDGE